MKLSQSILVIDDEDSICLAFEQFFSRRGWRVHLAATADEGLTACRRERPCVVFLDVRLPDRSGLDLLEDLAAMNAGVVVVTAYGGLETVVRAIQGKAFDYLVKPLDLDKALALAERIWQGRNAAQTAPHAASEQDADTLVGNSSPMQDVYKLIARAAASNSPVLILGDTGTGKEMVARAVHRFSARAGGPFVAMNCGAMPENLVESELFGHVRGAFTGAESDRKGRFESTDGGTLLLDEIGELPAGAQVKLLRVLDSGAIEPVGSSRSIRTDVRILASTNRNLATEVEQGRFRQDLYYRLAVLHIRLPALRERKEDILPLAEHFLRARSAAGGQVQALSAAAMESLMRHDWPGNVRELKNAIEHALAVAPNRAILPDDFPQAVAHAHAGDAADLGQLKHVVIEYATKTPDVAADKLHRTLQEAERALIAYAMERFNGNQSEAAEYLGLHRNTLRNKLREML